MSALTKIFVVLLVVLSLLLSAGVIVFVNHQENYKGIAETAKQAASKANQDKVVANLQLAKIESERAATVNDLTNQINTLNTAVQTAQGTISQRDTQVAELQQNVAQLTAANASSSQALQVAQAANKAQEDNFNQLRTSDDKVQKQLVESNLQINDLTSKLEVTTKHDRFMGEQNTQLAQQNAQYADLLHKYGISLTGAPSAGGVRNATPSININGIVQTTQSSNGVQYATINLGSAEQVTRGMQFKVIDPAANKFLGYLTVDNVDAHAAVGHLEGPAISQVRHGAEVRTQL